MRHQLLYDEAWIATRGSFLTWKANLAIEFWREYLNFVHTKIQKKKCLSSDISKSSIKNQEHTPNDLKLENKQDTECFSHSK